MIIESLFRSNIMNGIIKKNNSLNYNSLFDLDNKINSLLSV